MTRACRKVAQLFICERFVEIQVHSSYCLNWQEIENFLKLRKLIKRKLCDQEDLVFFFFTWALVILDCIFFHRCVCWSLKRVSSRGFDRFASCFLLKFETLFNFIYSRKSCRNVNKQVQTHDPSPSFTKGINGRLTVASNLNISETWERLIWV